MRISYLLFASTLAATAILHGCATTRTAPPVKTETPAAAADVEAIPVPAGPRSGNPALSEAIKLMQQKEWKAAEQRLLALVAAEPALTGAHTNLGIVYFRLGDFAQAENSLKQALFTDSARPLAHNYLGIVYRSQGRFADARAAYDEALRIAPNYSAAHLNLGVLLDLYLGEPHKALEHFERYQALHSTEDTEVKRWILDLKRRLPAAAGGNG